MTDQALWEDRDEDFETDDTNEESEDLSLSAEDFRNLIIAPSDWTIGTLYELIGRQIDLDPAFQRRNVWSPRSKSRFIESIFLGIPIPQILLTAKPGQKNSFLVLDGKQRLLTIREFISTADDIKPFRLRGMRILKEFEGKSWKDIKQNEDDVDRLLNETQRTSVLRGWKNDPVLYEIFFRINAGSVKLSPMELRMSLYPGDFLKFVIKWTETIGPIHHLLKKRTPDPRMADVELAVRHLAFKDNRIVYSGNLKAFLDETCRLYNVEFSTDSFERTVTDRLNLMNEAIQGGIDLIGENNFCRKFIDGRYETQFNRAIFDVMAFYLSIPQFLAWARQNPQEIIEKYQSIFALVGFQRSIETTTKSIGATQTRFTLASKHFGDASGLELPIPMIAALGKV